MIFVHGGSKIHVQRKKCVCMLRRRPTVDCHLTLPAAVFISLFGSWNDFIFAVNVSLFLCGIADFI